MPTTLNPNPTAGIPTSLTGPQDGELANAVSVNGPFQRLLDGLNVEQIASFGRKLRPRFRVTDPGSATPTVTIEPLGKIFLTTGGGALWGVLSNTVLNAVRLDTAYGGTVPVNTRIYLYAFNNSGTIGWVANATPPANDLMYGSSTDFVFIGSFLTVGSNTFFDEAEYGADHLINAGGWYGAAGNPPPRVLSAGTATVSTAVPVYSVAGAQVVPTYAKEIILWYESFGNAQISGKTPAGDGFTVNSANNTTSYAETGFLTMIPVDGGNVYYKIGSVGGSLNLYLWGWKDPR